MPEVPGKFNDNSKSIATHDCSICDKIPCTNFYRKGDKDFKGGEIYVFQQLIEKKVVLPCNVGDVTYTLCKLWSNLGSHFPSSIIFYQCIRDLRASAYLLLSCHYRSSIQLLRPVIENYIIGIWWDAKFALTNQSFRSFFDDKYMIHKSEWQAIYQKKQYQNKLGYAFCLKWLNNAGLPIRKESEIYQLMEKLNNYIHPSFGAYEIGKESCPGCSSFVKYEQSEYEKCLNLYQDTAALMLDILYEYTKTFFTEEGESADQIIIQNMGSLKDLEWVETEVGTRLIFSDKLRTFLSKKEFSV